MGNICIALMPFAKAANSRFAAIKSAGEKVGLTVSRVDQHHFSGNILEGIARALATADLVVADLNGANPNVMYELAIAQRISQRVLLLADDPKSAPPILE